MDFEQLMELIARAIEIAGVAAIVIGAVVASAAFGVRWRGSRALDEAFPAYRQGLGRAILLGLEFLIAADIVRTVAVAPSFQSLGLLAGIVLIRTFLSFTLQLDVDGRWPWERRRDRQRAPALEGRDRSAGP